MKSGTVRALLIHQAFCGPADPGGTRHYEIAQRLVAMGHRFTVVTSRYSYLTGEEKRTSELYGGIDVRWAKTIVGLHRSYSWRVLVFFSFMLSSILAALRVGEIDVVIGTTPSIFQAVSAWIIAAIRRRPFVLEVRDLWPEFAISLGVLRNPALIFLARRCEAFLYARADRIIVNSPAYREYLLRKGIPESRVSTVANGVDVRMFHPEQRGEAFRREHELNNKFIVMYAGAFGFANDIGCLLRAAFRLREETDVVFTIVGGGKESLQLRDQARSLCLTNIRFIPAQPKQHMNEILAAADVCVATLKDVPMFRMTYPNKVFDYMAAGRPTIIAIDGVIRDVVEDARGGIFVNPADDTALANAIRRLRSSPGLRREMGANARSYVQQYFNRDVQAREFASILQDLCCLAPKGMAPALRSDT